MTVTVTVTVTYTAAKRSHVSRVSGQWEKTFSRNDPRQCSGCSKIRIQPRLLQVRRYNVYICMYAWICVVCMYVYIHISLYMTAMTRVHILWVHIYLVCVYVFACACMYIRMHLYVHMYVCMYVCTYFLQVLLKHRSLICVDEYVRTGIIDTKHR